VNPLESHRPEEPDGYLLIRSHAVERYIERVDGSLSHEDALREMTQLANGTALKRSSPSWMRSRSQTWEVDGYLEVTEDICFPVHDGCINTVITRSLVEATGSQSNAERPDPQWPDRRYVETSSGGIECRTIVDGHLATGVAAHRGEAWEQLRDWFHSRGLDECFEKGQAMYKSQRQREGASA